MSYHDEFGDELDDLREDLGKLRSDAAILFETLFEASRESAGHLSGRLKHHAEDLLDELQAGLRGLRQRGREELANLGEAPVKPLLGLAIAVGAGFVLAHVLRRRD